MTPGCYWEHGTPQNLHYLCLDGESTVCPRCCVEVCPVKAPEWFAACAASGHPTWPSVRRAVPMKLVCLESAWDTKAFGNLSVRGFFEAMRPLIHPPLQLAYRPIESARHLAHYTRKPDGVLWTDPEAFDAPIFYLAFHGAPGSITSMLEPIGPEALCEAFQGYGGYDNLIYLASCSVLRGPEGRTFGEELLRTSGSRAVIGYTTDVGWMDSLVVDLLFLYRFYTHPDPWHNLPAIFASVEHDFAPARALGYTFLQREGM